MIEEYGNENFLAYKQRLFYESRLTNRGKIFESVSMYARRTQSAYDPLAKLRNSGKMGQNKKQSGN